MRISDWSSDVCSSDLRHRCDRRQAARLHRIGSEQQRREEAGAARQKQFAGLGRGEAEHRHGKSRNDKGAAQERRAGPHTDAERKSKKLRMDGSSVEQANITNATYKKQNQQENKPDT